MPRTRVLAVAFATVVFLAVVPFALAGGGNRNSSSNAIWIQTTGGAAATASPMLGYGQSFSAGYTSKASSPWAHAQCFDASGSAFWSEWRATQADGSIGVFDLTTNTGQTWPSGSARCTLELVSLQPKMNVLASTSFGVAAS
jgi:hypothetical protein